MRNIQSIVISIPNSKIIVLYHGKKMSGMVISIFSEEGTNFLTSDEFQWAKFEKKVVVKR